MENIVNLIPEKYRTTALLLLAISPFLTRAFHALRTGGGIKGILSAIWLGTNTPKATREPGKDDPNQSKLLFAILLGLAMVCAGCSTSHVKVESPDGRKMSGFNSRWFWNTEGFSLHSTATNSFSLEIQKSNPDAESLKAVAEGAAKGAVKGVAP
jgi:hypothetical protein